MRRPALIAVVVLASVVVLLHGTGAVADTTMSPDPGINVNCGEARGYPGVIVYLARDQEDDLHYTVTDQDTFTKGPPMPPPPPYGDYKHDGKIQLVLWGIGSTDYLQGSVSPGVGAGWSFVTQFDVHLKNVNHTGAEKWASFSVGWDDEALGPDGNPGTLHGSADDDEGSFSKDVSCQG